MLPFFPAKRYGVRETATETPRETAHYVHFFFFDFTKAIDAVGHAELMNKMAQLQIPDSVYNSMTIFSKIITSAGLRDMQASVRSGTETNLKVGAPVRRESGGRAPPLFWL